MAQIHLSSKGRQDIYLTENPEISFFKHNYKKYSNFSIEAFKLTPDYNNNLLSFGKKNNIQIKRHGDLLSNVYLNIKIKAKNTTKRWGWVSNLGNNLIKTVELQIGPSVIDKLYSSWLNIWYELSLDTELKNNYYNMIGDNEYNKIIRKDNNERISELFIPIPFFFMKFTGLALPLIQLQFHPVVISFELNDYKTLINSDIEINNTWDFEPKIVESNLIADYIFLDNIERNIFAKCSNELLIEQLNLNEIVLNSNSIEYNEIIKLNNHTKSLYWIVNMNKYIDSKNKYENIFLGENIKIATIRFILIAICGTTNSNISITSNISAGSIFKISDDYLIETYDKSGIVYSIGTTTKLNKNYKFYNEIKNVIENCIITKEIKKNSSSILEVDETFISINNYLDNYTYSLQINKLLETSTSNIYKPFEILNRSNVSGGIGTKSYDLILYNYDNYGLYLDKETNPIDFFKFNLDTQERIEKLDSNYYNYLQPYYYHKNIPSCGLNMYSFSLNPENYQPSGSCNMSEITNIELNFTTNEEVSTDNFAIFKFYSLNYNILRITSGMGGLRFTN